MSAPSTEVGPGFLAFVAFFFLAAALWLIMRGMFRRMRRITLAHRAEEQRAERERSAGTGSPEEPSGADAEGDGSGVGDRTEEGQRRGDEV